MELNLNQLKCGQCGEEKHLLYVRENGEVLSECVECKSLSEIVATEPQIDIRHVSGDGTLCVFPT